MSDKLIVVLGEEGAKLAEASAKIAKDFIPHWESLQTNCQTGQAIIDTFAGTDDGDDKEALAEQAHQCWKAINGSVNSISRVHEVIKKPINEAGKVVDTFKRLPTNHAKGIKDELKAITKYKEDAERERKFKTREDRQNQITEIGGAWAIYEDLGEIDPERFDIIFEAELEKDKARKIIKENAERLEKLEADALRVRQDAERLEQAKELAKVEIAEAKAKAIQDGINLVNAQADKAKADAEKVIADEALRVANIETARLQAIQTKAVEQAKLEKEQAEALLQGGDKEKVKKLGAEARVFNDLLDSLGLKSEEGKALYSRLSPILAGVITDLIRTYKAL